MIRERKVKDSIVAITEGETEVESLKKNLDLLPISQIIKKQDKVVIIPNWVNSNGIKTGATVGDKTLKSLIKYIKTKNPSQIYIAAGSGREETKNVFHNVGYDKIIKEENVEFIDLNYGPYVDIELEYGLLKSTPINKIIKEADVIVSFTQLKHHEEATISASIKNMVMSSAPAQIHGHPKKATGIHEDLHGFIRGLANQIPIDLSIISCDKAMIGTGPSNGKAVDTKGLIITSTDAVSADAVGARLLGFLPQAVCYLYNLYNDKVGQADPLKMQILGIQLQEAEQIFSKCAYDDKEIMIDNDYIKSIHGEKV